MAEEKKTTTGSGAKFDAEATKEINDLKRSTDTAALRNLVMFGSTRETKNLVAAILDNEDDAEVAKSVNDYSWNNFTQHRNLAIILTALLQRFAAGTDQGRKALAKRLLRMTAKTADGRELNLALALLSGDGPTIKRLLNTEAAKALFVKSFGIDSSTYTNSILPAYGKITSWTFISRKAIDTVAKILSDITKVEFEEYLNILDEMKKERILATKRPKSMYVGKTEFVDKPIDMGIVHRPGVSELLEGAENYIIGHPEECDALEAVRKKIVDEQHSLSELITTSYVTMLINQDIIDHCKKETIDDNAKDLLKLIEKLIPVYGAPGRGLGKNVRVAPKVTPTSSVQRSLTDEDRPRNPDQLEPLTDIARVLRKRDELRRELLGLIPKYMKFLFTDDVDKTTWSMSAEEVQKIFNDDKSYLDLVQQFKKKEILEKAFNAIIGNTKAESTERIYSFRLLTLLEKASCSNPGLVKTLIDKQRVQEPPKPYEPRLAKDIISDVATKKRCIDYYVSHGTNTFLKEILKKALEEDDPSPERILGERFKNGTTEITPSTRESIIQASIELLSSVYRYDTRKLDLIEKVTDNFENEYLKNDIVEHFMPKSTPDATADMPSELPSGNSTTGETSGGAEEKTDAYDKALTIINGYTDNAVCVRPAARDLRLYVNKTLTFYEIDPRKVTNVKTSLEKANVHPEVFFMQLERIMYVDAEITDDKRKRNAADKLWGAVFDGFGPKNSFVDHPKNLPADFKHDPLFIKWYEEFYKNQK